LINSGSILIFLLISVSTLFIAPFSAASASEVIRNFHSDITVHEDASMTVRETIQVSSEGIQIRHGIYRDFPINFEDALGNRYRVGLTVLNVQRDGSPEPYHMEDIANGKRIYIGDKDVMVPFGEHTYTIAYKTTRQIGFFQDHDELYWNVTGNRWEFPIQKASASVILPGDAVRNIISEEAYTGPQGSRGRDFQTSTGPSRSVEFLTTKPLNAHEGLTIVVAWPKGYVAAPAANTKISYFIADNRGVLIGSFGLIVIFLYYFLVWARSGRDPSPGVIVTRYTPPDNMSPAVMRYITKMKYDDRTFAAAVINMAVKGFLTIVDEYGEYALQKKEGGTNPLTPEEERIMKKLLGQDKEITLETANHLKIKSAIDALRNYLALTYEKIYFITNKRFFIIGLAMTVVLLFLSGLWDAIDKGRLPFFLFISLWLSIWSVGVIGLLSQVVNRWKNAFRNRHGKIVNTGGAVFLTLFAIPFVAGQLAGMAILGYSTSVLMIFFLLLASFINYLFYHLLKAPTRAGRNLLDAIEGFKVFLTATEKERLNMLNPPRKTPELFEKYLPYALALDIEQQWAEQFAAILAGAAEGGAKAAYAPVWYTGAALSAMSYGDFASSLGSSFSGAISSSSAAPGSSSGSGGGGSAGGGGGGGGGGGW
jgi:uncharacterized membrane protein YgcG